MDPNENLDAYGKSFPFVNILKLIYSKWGSRVDP